MTGMGSDHEIGETQMDGIDLNSPEVKALVDAAVADQLTKIRGQLDAAHARREEAEKLLRQQEAEKKAAELKALEETGRVTEALQIRLKEAEEALVAAKAHNDLMDRERALSRVLDPAEFATKRAYDAALNEISAGLTRREDGTWVHKTGLPLADYAKAFVADAENAYLLRPKSTTAAGVPQGPGRGSTKPLTAMTTAELLAAAASGQLN